MREHCFILQWSSSKHFHRIWQIPPVSISVTMTVTVTQKYVKLLLYFSVTSVIPCKLHFIFIKFLDSPNVLISHDRCNLCPGHFNWQDFNSESQEMKGNCKCLVGIYQVWCTSMYIYILNYHACDCASTDFRGCGETIKLQVSYPLINFKGQFEFLNQWNGFMTAQCR